VTGRGDSVAEAAPLPSHLAHARRTYVLDTNVLLYDPNALFVFDEHDVVIPMTVIEEIDRFKKDVNETGRNARSVSRHLDALRARGSLREGVELPGSGRLRVESLMRDEEIGWVGSSNDNRILQVVRRLHASLNGAVALVTRDTNMRLKCDALGVATEDYRHARLDVDEQYTGARYEVVDDTLVGRVLEGEAVDGLVGADLLPNQFLVLTSDVDPKKTAMLRFKRGKLRPVARFRDGVFGLNARNREQLFALDLLLDDDVPLVTLSGLAGGGKTLLAVACGLQRVVEDQAYRKMLISRPIFPLGRDIGFLPGDVEQKLNPWMKPIMDNLELLFTRERGARTRGGPDTKLSQLVERRVIEVEPLTYIRGRSIPNQWLIVDEAQNLTPHEIKTVLTRAGERTKVILTGDPQQIDNPYVDGLSNGLTYTIERFKDAELAGHITMRKGERSELAELAARVM
jgi:PhoH-like ATPase